MRAQVRGYRLQRPAAQMAGDGGAIADDLADRGVIRSPVRQHAHHRPDHAGHSPGPLTGPRHRTGRLGGHKVPLRCASPAKIGSHHETTSLGLAWNSACRCRRELTISWGFVTHDLGERFPDVAALTAAL